MYNGKKCTKEIIVWKKPKDHYYFNHKTLQSVIICDIEMLDISIFVRIILYRVKATFSDG